MKQTCNEWTYQNKLLSFMSSTVRFCCSVDAFLATKKFQKFISATCSCDLKRFKPLCTELPLGPLYDQLVTLYNRRVMRVHIRINQQSYRVVYSSFLLQCACIASYNKVSKVYFCNMLLRFDANVVPSVQRPLECVNDWVTSIG